MSEIDLQIKAVFRRDAFEVTTLEQAMAVTVTPERGVSSAERWQNETRYLVENIGSFLAMDSQSCVLDYGCGTGRIAKELIERHGCSVAGIDASKSLRLLAPDYVLSERFTVWSPETLDKMIAKGFRADFCICLWVIQHAFSATEVIERIWSALKPGGLLYSLNQLTRCVPTDKGWINDGFDMRAGLCQLFVEENIHPLPASVSTAQFEVSTMIQVLRKPAT